MGWNSDRYRAAVEYCRVKNNLANRDAVMTLLAEQVKGDPVKVRRYLDFLREESKGPKLDELDEIAKVLGVNKEWLLKEANHMEKENENTGNVSGISDFCKSVIYELVNHIYDYLGSYEDMESIECYDILLSRLQRTRAVIPNELYDEIRTFVIKFIEPIAYSCVTQDFIEAVLEQYTETSDKGKRYTAASEDGETRTFTYKPNDDKDVADEIEFTGAQWFMIKVEVKERFDNFVDTVIKQYM